MARYMGAAVKGKRGFAAIIREDHGDSTTDYRVNPLGEEVDFYSEDCAQELAERHAALANKRGRIDSFINVKKL